MKRHDEYKKRALGVFVLLVLLLGPFTVLRAHALSIEEERTLGKQFLTNIKTRFELIEEDYSNKFINGLGTYLIVPLEIQYFPFSFYIIKNNSLNAFAAPGGHIFIFSGLIEALDSLDELASVICHEIGHVSARHLSKRIELSKKIGLATMAGVLVGALIGGEAAAALVTGSLAAGLQTQLHYSRQDERQADQLGYKYMRAAGFDPAGMLSVLNKIEKGQLWGSDKVPAYLLTHPSGPERMANLESMLERPDPGTPPVQAAQFKTQFPLFKTILRATTSDSSEAEKHFKHDLERDPDSALPHLGLGILYKARSEYDLAIFHLEKAMALKSNSIPILRTLAEAYQMKGQDREAVKTLEKALRIDDGDKSTLFLLAVSYENLEQYDKAIRLFDRLSRFKPVRNEVYYHLGLSYGRQNKLAFAHYHFGIYFKNRGQTEKARFHFLKADELAKGNPALKKKIQQASEGLPRESHPEDKGRQRKRDP